MDRHRLGVGVGGRSSRNYVIIERRRSPLTVGATIIRYMGYTAVYIYPLTCMAHTISVWTYVPIRQPFQTYNT